MLELAIETHSEIGEREAPPEGPGIIVLSSSLQLLHMNCRAGVLLGDLVSATPEARKPISRTAPLPPPLVRLAGKILSVLRQRDESADHDQCEIHYLADNSVKHVLIRGIGMPSGDGFVNARVVFVISDTNGYRLNTDSIPIEAP